MNLPLVVGNRVRTTTFVALGALAVLNGLDVVTTHVILTHGAVESDPLSAILLASKALLWVKLGIIALLGLKVAHSRPHLGVMAAACFAAGIYAAAVLSNVLIMRLVGA